MILISHRGNTNGKFESYENEPMYIDKAISQGFDVEIDIWMIDGILFLGHDKPQYENVRYEFLLKRGMWLHAKNGDAFYELLRDYEAHVFWHKNEDWVLTSKGIIWTYPNKFLYANSICVLPELGYNGKLKDCMGICSDYISKYEKT